MNCIIKWSCFGLVSTWPKSCGHNEWTQHSCVRSPGQPLHSWCKIRVKGGSGNLQVNQFWLQKTGKKLTNIWCCSFWKCKFQPTFMAVIFYGHWDIDLRDSSICSYLWQACIYLKLCSSRNIHTHRSEWNALGVCDSVRPKI